MARDAIAAAATRESDLGQDVAAEVRRRVMLCIMDRLWRAQLRDLDDAYNGLMLRTAAGGDPLTEYQRAASLLATRMWEEIDVEFVGFWFKVEVTVEQERAERSSEPEESA